MVDRRSSPRMTLTQILDTMQATADAEHDGDLQNNVLQVFAKLPRDSKRTFLHRSLMLLWEAQIEIAQRGMRDIVVDEDLVIEREQIAEERRLIVTTFPVEQQKLRTKLIQVVFIGGFVVFMIILMMVLFTDTNGITLGGNDLLTRIVKVVQFVSKIMTRKDG